MWPCWLHLCVVQYILLCKQLAPLLQQLATRCVGAPGLGVHSMVHRLSIERLAPQNGTPLKLLRQAKQPLTLGLPKFNSCFDPHLFSGLLTCRCSRQLS